MAKTLTRPRGRGGGTYDRHERELKRLLLSICDDTGFRLYLATYDHPKRRTELIDRIVSEAEVEKVRVTRLDLAEAGQETNLVGSLRAQLQTTDLPPGWRQAVMVTGIEQRLDYARGREGYAFLHQANLLRDALPEAAPVPVVLWLSRLASAALSSESPDLWHWRAANFDFTGDKSPRVELLRELTTLGPEDDSGLSGEQRHARIRMLEDLLAELEGEGPPRSKRQKAERASLLLELGIEDGHLGCAAEAIQRFERALEIFREISDRRGEAYAFCGLGLAYADLSKPRRAVDYSEQSLKIMREIGDRRGEGVVLGHLGRAYSDLGEVQRAINHFKQCLAIAHDVSDRRGEANALNGLGNAYFSLREPLRAIEQYEQWLKIAGEIGDRRGEGNALRNLGSAYLSLGEPQRSIEFYEQALAVAREFGDRRGEGNSLYNSAQAFDQLEERDEAIRRMEEALAIYKQIEDPNAGRARAKLAEWRGEGGG